MLQTNQVAMLLESYTGYMQSVGFKLKKELKTLQNFRDYTLEINYKGNLTRNIVLEWISTGVQNDKTMGRKIETVRPFMKYSATIDTNTEIIRKNPYSNVHSRPVPYIYTEQEVIKLMDECKKLYSPDGIRSYTTKIVIGLLWTCGLRPSEVIHLKIEDIDTKLNIIHIKNSKFNSERNILMDATVSHEVSKYKEYIYQKIGEKSFDEPLFYTTYGIPLSMNSLYYSFKCIRQCINAKPIGYKYVRLYDFRHSMACRTIKKWLLSTEDINHNLYSLSVYMGHKKPQDTYWYLSATPDLLELVNIKYENYILEENTYE